MAGRRLPPVGQRRFEHDTATDQLYVYRYTKLPTRADPTSSEPLRTLARGARPGPGDLVLRVAPEGWRVFRVDASGQGWAPIGASEATPGMARAARQIRAGAGELLRQAHTRPGGKRSRAIEAEIARRAVEAGAAEPTPGGGARPLHPAPPPYHPRPPRRRRRPPAETGEEAGPGVLSPPPPGTVTEGPEGEGPGGPAAEAPPAAPPPLGPFGRSIGMDPDELRRRPEGPTGFPPIEGLRTSADLVASQLAEPAVSLRVHLDDVFRGGLVSEGDQEGQILQAIREALEAAGIDPGLYRVEVHAETRDYRGRTAEWDVAVGDVVAAGGRRQAETDTLYAIAAALYQVMPWQGWQLSAGRARWGAAPDVDEMHEIDELSLDIELFSLDQ